MKTVRILSLWLSFEGRHGTIMQHLVTHIRSLRPCSGKSFAMSLIIIYFVVAILVKSMTYVSFLIALAYPRFLSRLQE